jgi:hypothetical protein
MRDNEPSIRLLGIIMINWIASRIHAAWLNELYNWMTIERGLGYWSVISTEDPSFRLDFPDEDKGEAWIDRRCAHAAAVFILCFWRKEP